MIKRHHTKIKNSSKEKKDDNEDVHNKFNQGGFKLLNKPHLYVSFFIELNVLLIIFVIISIVEISMSKINNNMFKSIIQTRNIFFNNLILFVKCLLFIYYQ